MAYSKDLRSFINQLLNEERQISSDRKEELIQLSSTIFATYRQTKRVNLHVICTHNSRRSQLGQIWFLAGAQYFNFNFLKSFSAGTETTAFNPRMVKAVQEAGFSLEKIQDGENPKYQLSLFGKTQSPLFYSKRYDDSSNEMISAIALMVCDSANESCPVIPDVLHRIPLLYKDPKFSDDTPDEEEVYLNKVYEIGREVLYLLKELNQLLERDNNSI